MSVKEVPSEDEFNPRRILITGSRDFANRELLFLTLDRLHEEHGFTLLIHGDAQGADRLAGEWAGTYELELGGLIAALSAVTEDETDLDLRVRALVESGRFRIAIGCDAAPAALEN